MKGRRLILADGTEIENGKAGYSGGFLWCYFDGITLNAAALIFFSPERTQSITFEYGEMRDIYEGFTDCRSLSINMDGEISVCMAKGAEENA